MLVVVTTFAINSANICVIFRQIFRSDAVIVRRFLGPVASRDIFPSFSLKTKQIAFTMCISIAIPFASLKGIMAAWIISFIGLQWAYIRRTTRRVLLALFKVVNLLNIFWSGTVIIFFGRGSVGASGDVFSFISLKANQIPFALPVLIAVALAS